MASQPTTRDGLAGTDERGPGGGRPYVLACTSELPWPLNTGGHLRTFHLLRALARRFRVHLVAPAEGDCADKVAALKEAGVEAEAVPVAPRSRWREALRAGLAAFRREPYVFYRRHDRLPVRRALRAAARRRRPDVLYLDHLDSFVYRPIVPGAPAVLDLHNVYSSLAARAADEQRSAATRLYLRREARLLRRAEAMAARGADAVLAVSADDAARLRGPGRPEPRVVPNGVDCAAYRHLPVGRGEGRPLLLYVGALSWGPNAAAAEYLARHVLPEIRRHVLDARVRVIGRDPPPALREAGRLPGVEVAGGVPDVVPHLREAHALVVPLMAGGGTRLKILEAFAAGLPVVSTPVGCEGLDVADGEHLLVAGREGLAASAVRLLRDPGLGRALAGRARRLAEERYDWGVVGEAACEAVASVLNRASERHAP
jgi:glycosyltransferase involved in cell wall biosynthesis